MSLAQGHFRADGLPIVPLNYPVDGLPIVPLAENPRVDGLPVVPRDNYRVGGLPIVPVGDEEVQEDDNEEFEEEDDDEEFDDDDNEDDNEDPYGYEVDRERPFDYRARTPPPYVEPVYEQDRDLALVFEFPLEPNRDQVEPDVEVKEEDEEDGEPVIVDMYGGLSQRDLVILWLVYTVLHHYDEHGYVITPLLGPEVFPEFNPNPAEGEVLCVCCGCYGTRV
ncbi:hypothetical protein QBC35DRAFT_456850 [Podospora australis]|uniref:Uncharacterized protein n=1 Tax=Podospora australis TaxID=1536484 RepID=A0AAN6WIU3_9PEZI|nr:hypothetical protein QBC35DRAFT_456850 [Podospora australis]